MTEQALQLYFINEITAAELNNDVKGSEQKTSYNVYSVSVVQLKGSNSFNIKVQHLIKLCGDVIAGEITFKNLNIIAYALMFSEYFYWDTDTKNGEMVGKVIDDWDNTDIGHPITIDNLILWKTYLKTGVYNLKS